MHMPSTAHLIELAVYTVVVFAAGLVVGKKNPKVADAAASATEAAATELGQAADAASAALKKAKGQ